MRETVIYGTANVIRQAVPFLLVPFLTRHMTTADYGVTAVFAALVSAFTPLVGINLHAAVSRRYFDREECDFPAYVFACLLLLAGATSVVGLGTLAFEPWITGVSDFPPDWLWTTVVTASTQMLFFIVLALWQVQGSAVGYGVLQISRSVFVTGLSVWLVVFLGMNWRGAVVAQTASALLFGVLSIGILMKGNWLRPRVDGSALRHAVGFGLPLVPHSLAASLMLVVDRMFVTHYAGLAETGLYSLGYQLGLVILLIQDSFNTAWQPWLFRTLKLGSEATKRKIVRFTYLYFAGLVAAALLLGLVAQPVLSILAGEEFQGAHVFVVWIGLGYAFDGMYKIVGGYLFFTGRTGLLSWITTTVAVVHATLNWWLVPSSGAPGAAQATTIAFFVSFALTWIASSRVYAMPWLSALRPVRPDAAP